MEQRISIITLGVADLAAARRFYDALGWRAASEAHASTVVPYNLNGMAIALFSLKDLAEDAGVAIERSGYSSLALAYNVDSEAEVDAVLAAAVAAGGELVKPGQKTSWGGYAGYFADPDRYLWEVAFNPHAPLGPDGEFQW